MSPALYFGSYGITLDDEPGETIFIAAGGGGVFVPRSVEVRVGDEFAGVRPGDDGDLADLGFDLVGEGGGGAGRGGIIAEQVINGDAQFLSEDAEFGGGGRVLAAFPIADGAEGEAGELGQPRLGQTEAGAADSQPF